MIKKFKEFKEFVTEEISGVDTFDRPMKKLVKDMETMLKKRKIPYERIDGYNSAWFNFLGHEIYVSGMSGGRQYKIYKNKREGMNYATAKHVINYLQTGHPMNAPE